MAKLALVRYGSEGEGPENDPKKSYTYVVNDNVRKGDRISPVVVHWGAKKTVYSTTGVVQATAKNASTEKGKEMQAGLEGKEATDVYTAKELGIRPEKDASGKFIKQGVSSPKRSERPQGEPYVAGKTEMAIRGGNMMAYVAKHGGGGDLSNNAVEDVNTFMGYSAPFIPTGKR